MLEAVLLKPALDLASSVLKPLTVKAWDWTTTTAKELQFNMCFGKLEAHIKNSYLRNLYFTSLVFRNEQKKLDDYYLPLTFVGDAINSAGTIKIDKFPYELY